MRIRWEYEFDELGERAPGWSEAPLHWDGEAVLVPTQFVEDDPELLAKAPRWRRKCIAVHRVADGDGSVTAFVVDQTLLDRDWSFSRLGKDLVLHVGRCFVLPSGDRIDALPYGSAPCLQHEGRLFFTRAAEVHCHDATTRERTWMRELSADARSATGPLALRDGRLYCHGGGVMNVIDPASGDVERTWQLPRVERLFAPVSYEGDLIFPYTAGSSGGLLRFDPRKGEQVWKFSRRGRASPPGGAALPVQGNTAIVSFNDGSSLVGVDLDEGEARWSHRAQWLYAPLAVHERSILFGTAGGYGRHLRRHDVHTGETEWAVAMDGGCVYYATDGDHLVAGDRKGILRRIRRSDGEVTDELATGGSLQGPPLVANGCTHVLRWPRKARENRPVLLAVEAD